MSTRNITNPYVRKFKPHHLSPLHLLGSDHGGGRGEAASILLRDKAIEFFNTAQVIPSQKLAAVLKEQDRAKKNKMKPSDIEQKLSTSQGLQVGSNDP